MKTKEAIEILKMYKHPNPKDDFVYKENKELDDIIALLQQEEKYKNYKLMWEAFNKNWGGYSINKSYRQYLNLSSVMKEYEQKILPKGN